MYKMKLNKMPNQTLFDTTNLKYMTYCKLYVLETINFCMWYTRFPNLLPNFLYCTMQFLYIGYSSAKTTTINFVNMNKNNIPFSS